MELIMKDEASIFAKELEKIGCHYVCVSIILKFAKELERWLLGCHYVNVLIVGWKHYLIQNTIKASLSSSSCKKDKKRY